MVDFYKTEEVQQDMPYLNKKQSSTQVKGPGAQAQVKQIMSTHQMLKNLESSSMSLTGVNKETPKNSRQGAVTSMGNQGSPGIKSILKQSFPQKSRELSSFQLQKNSISSDDDSDSSLDMQYRQQEPQVVISKQPTGKNLLVEAKTKGSSKQVPVNKPSNKDLDTIRIQQIATMNTDQMKKSFKSNQGRSADLNMIKKQRSGKGEHKPQPSNEQHIENFIQSISPFKDILGSDMIGGMKKEHSVGASTGFGANRKRRQTLKVNEPQLNLFSGKGPVRANRNENVVEKDLGRSGSNQMAQRKSFKRSTTLLANIKEEHKPEEDRAGVVPNDLTYDFLKDLIAEQEREEKRQKSKGDQGAK